MKDGAWQKPIGPSVAKLDQTASVQHHIWWLQYVAMSSGLTPVKNNAPLELAARSWISEALPVHAEALSGEGDDDLAAALKSGVILCELANALEEKSVKKISSSKMPFPQRENILSFINAARALGVPDRDNFDTGDLFEASNMRQVLICISSLGRASKSVQGYGGPTLSMGTGPSKGGAKTHVDTSAGL